MICYLMIYVIVLYIVSYYMTVAPQGRSLRAAPDHARGPRAPPEGAAGSL